MKPKRMYIATPINGIPSNCGFDGKVAKARHRIETLIQVLIVPTEQVFEDTPFRVMAFIGCVCENGCNVPRNVITTGDILNWEHGTDRLLMDMDAETTA